MQRWRETIVPKAFTRCKGRCTCTRPNSTFPCRFLVIFSASFTLIFWVWLVFSLSFPARLS